MRRGRLPLTALRSFEAAGRLESATLAADELSVSQSAVSRQIRDLESLVGRRLFDRRHRGLDLTADGVELMKVLTRSFDEIETVLAAFGAKAPASEARISVEPSFAAGWLVPRLKDFAAAHPDIDVVVESDSRLVSFRRGEPELAIRYGAVARRWPATQSRHLVDIAEIAVASPGFLEGVGAVRRPADLLSCPLLHQDDRDFWRRWFEAAGVVPDRPIRGHVYADAGLLLQAALAGQGVALLDAVFAAEPVGDGRLVRLFPQSIDGGAYFLVARDFRRLSAPAGVFVRWIEAAMGVKDPA